MTRAVLSTRAFSQTCLNSDSPVLQKLLHHSEGKEGQQCNYTKHTQQAYGSQFKLSGLLKGQPSEWHKVTLLSPTEFLRLHLFDISDSKEEHVPVTAAFNLLVTKLGKSTTKISALNAKSEMKELVLLLNRRN